MTPIPAKSDISVPGQAFLDQLARHPELSGLGVAVAQIVGLVDEAQSAIPQLTQAIIAEPFIARNCCARPML